MYCANNNGRLCEKICRYLVLFRAKIWPADLWSRTPRTICNSDGPPPPLQRTYARHALLNIIVLSSDESFHLYRVSRKLIRLKLGNKPHEITYSRADQLESLCTDGASRNKRPQHLIYNASTSTKKKREDVLIRAFLFRNYIKIACHASMSRCMSSLWGSSISHMAVACTEDRQVPRAISL